MKQLLFVCLGGGLGSAARYAISKLLNTAAFPYGTLAVNVLGSFLIGLFFGFFLKEQNQHQIIYLLLITGFCGGFTTFSAFSYDNFIFLKHGNYNLFFLYGVGSYIVGIAAVFLGIYFSKNL